MDTFDDDDWNEIEYERECPYFARWHRFDGHDPNAVCAFSCHDEPICVTGSWLDSEEFQNVKADWEGRKSAFEYHEEWGLWVHHRDRCAGEHCTIHKPSDHHMVDWPMVLRASGLIERTCLHGIGHPDPDSVAYFTTATQDTHWGVHGCDGCCR